MSTFGISETKAKKTREREREKRGKRRRVAGERKG